MPKTLPPLPFYRIMVAFVLINSNIQRHNAERTKHLSNYGTQRLRLASGSLRSFNHCFLCLHAAIQPVSCQNGHLACRKCALENIHEQRQQLKGQYENALAELDKRKRRKESELEQRLEQKEASFIQQQLGVISEFNRNDINEREEAALGKGVQKGILPSFWSVTRSYCGIQFNEIRSQARHQR